jgi:hypothetical protein
MALTGQLSDMSLAELIEFFCNQRKTGRLKIDYQRGHSVFFIKDGELVDAKVGALSGAEAVYFSLTLPNAAFDFSPDVNPTRQTIRETWTQVVLEGLRRLDEGISPTEADAFGSWTPSESEMASFMDQVERLGENGAGKDASKKEVERNSGPSDAPLSMMVDGAAAGGGRKKWMVLGVAACVVLAGAVAAIPLSGRFGRKTAAASDASPVVASQPASPAESNAPANDGATNASPAETSPEAAPAEATNADATAADAALAARRAREEREREARERRERERRADEQARKSEDAAKLAEKPAAPVAAPVPTGPKTVRVSVSYDEAGRVTQASVAGTSPGAEAYGGTAVRIARGRRFPAGKAGSSVVTIPVN